MQRRQVLLVEDDPDLVALVTRALDAIQVETTAATDVAAGVDLFRRQSFDLVITDYRIPGGSGRELVHAVRESDVDVPLLLISGRVDKRELGEMIREAVDDFNEKPLDIPTFYASVNRLILLGDQRRRTKERAAALLDISSKLKIGMAPEALLHTLVQAVAEITPFESAVVWLVDDSGETVMPEATLGLRESGLQPFPAREMRVLYDRGYKLDVASFVPARLRSAPPATTARFNQVKARKYRWDLADHVLVEILVRERAWGFLRVGAPSDQLRPSEDSMRMLSLLANHIANMLENREAYRRQMRLSSHLELVGELVKTALGASDVAIIKRMITDVAVNRFGHSFACFLQPIVSGQFEVTDVACQDIAGYRETLRFGDAANAVLASVVASRHPLHLRDTTGGGSVLGRAKHRCSVVIPIYTRDKLRLVFVVEDDRHDEFDETDILAYTALSDQIGLVWSRALYQQYLERTGRELQESYGKLQVSNELNLRLQEVVRRYVPASTWESARQLLESDGGDSIEATVNVAVMFVDIVGFTRLSESATPHSIVGLLNAYFTMMSSIITQWSGEVIKYIGDGIMAYFTDRKGAIRAADDILQSQSRLMREVAALNVGDIALRVGVAYGPATLGHVGPVYYRDRTLLGDTVNTASRLEKVAKAGTAILDAQLIPEGDDPHDYGLEPVMTVSVRGRRQTISVLTFARDLAAFSQEKESDDADHSRVTR